MTTRPPCGVACPFVAETSEPIRVQREGAAALVTIAHPAANAVSRAVAAALLEALTAAETDPACRALVLTGDGDRYFSAGADLTEFPRDADDVTASVEVTRRLEASRLPVVAAVNGYALGGGCEIALACDLRICSENARFGQPEITLGIMPGWGGTQRLPRLLGRGRALEMLLTGEQIDSARALEWGLVTRVVPAGDLRTTALSLANLIAMRPPLAVAAIKRAVRTGLEGSLEDGLLREQEEFARLLATEDAREGLAAFREKRTRPPTWRGR
jgi:enoyl-CoA hydratase/carnithine racemase